ncbi:MAG TPA: hypothetical protein VG474_00815 [Solirubrobacteraceae bacterium]|nr:hypothetical protein [Solirubrobacteraceae bacterium]
MRPLRTASARRLSAIVALAAALALSAAVAQAALTGAGPVPAPKALVDAIVDALDGPEPDGLTARIEFTNKLVPAGALPGRAASPLAAGAAGRLWIQQGGDFRLELQSDAGDAQIVAVGDTLTLYDASSNTLYRARLPDDAAGRHDRGDERLTPANVRRALRRLAETWKISAAQPTSTAGRPTYTARIAPRYGGGLLGAAELAWDAIRGAPLRAAVYARGRTDPVLELEATDVSYDAVADDDVRVAPPAGAKVVDLRRGQGRAARGRHADASPRRGASPSRSRGRARSGAAAVAAVERRLDFDLAAPARLAGLPRRAVRLVTVGGERGALAIYGRGLGAIAVLQHGATANPRADEDAHGGGLRPAQIAIDGAPGSELATALGTVVTFERDGVAHVVAGSVAPALARSAARGLR